MKVAQLVKVWINLSYGYFSPYSPQRTNCNALDILLGANTEDCFFLMCPGHAIRQKPGFNSCHCKEGSSEGLVWQSLHAPAGPKRHTAVDTFGKRAAVVTAASVPEREARKQVLSFGLPDGTKGFTAVFDRLSIEVTAAIGILKSVMNCLGWMIQVVLRPQQTQGFVLLKKRSVVEQTFGWLNCYRRLSKDDRRLPACSRPTIYISLIRLIALVSLSEEYNQEKLLKPNCRR